MPSTAREYPTRPLVGIGIAVLRANPAAILLIRRAKPPSQGEWALPGGAQRLGETAEQAAGRELLEETGLRTGHLTLAGNVDSIHHDANGQIQFHYTILDFCTLHTGGEPRAGSDASDVAWAPLDQLASYNLWSEAIRIIDISRRILKV